MSLLEVSDLRAGYGETRVLDGVSLTVNAGEVVTLVGRNGVGKTTTLRAIVGAITPWAGTVRYDGEDVTGLSPEATVARGIGFVPEERRVFPGLTVTENLSLATHGGSDAGRGRSVESVLETFERLDERRDATGRHLSGGEQQMLAIARALVADADLLLLDEPTEGLAPLVVEAVADLVRNANETDGITVLLVEQNVATALELADRAYVLDQGRVVYEGTAADLEAATDVVDRHLGVSID